MGVIGFYIPTFRNFDFTPQRLVPLANAKSLLQLVFAVNCHVILLMCFFFFPFFFFWPNKPQNKTVSMEMMCWPCNGNFLASPLSMRQEYESESRNKNDTMKVGPGKLKLICCGNQGKFAQYINNKRNCFSLALFLIQIYNLRASSTSDAINAIV